MPKHVQKKVERLGVACAGNWILDTVHTISHWPEKSDLARIETQHVGLGGGPANVALGLKAMKVSYPIWPIGLIGAGALGDEVLRLCKEAGLPLDGLQRTTQAATSQTHVMNVPGDSRTFFQYPGTNSHLDASAINIEHLSESGVKLLYLGYLTLLDQLDVILPGGETVAAQVLSQARAKGIQTCVDLVSFKSERFRDVVEATLSAIDVLFANEQEAELATGVVVAGSADAMMQAARALKAGGVKKAVVLHSPEQVVWCGNDAEYSIEPDPIPVDQIISPVGAGDAFAAGVIHGLHEDWPIQSSLRFGMRAAVACLSGYTATEGMTDLVAPTNPP